MRRGKSREDVKIEKFMKQVGLNIRATREAKGMTLEDAEEAGYPSWRHLQQAESGKPMTLKSLYRAAKALGVHPSEFIKNVRL